MKTEWLQVRLTPAQKASLRRRAREAGMDLSAFVLAMVAPPAGERFRDLLGEFRNGADARFGLAELHDLLEDLAPAEFGTALADAPLEGLSEEARNRVAAMVEHAAARKDVPPPAWVAAVPPLDSPRFASDLPGLRLHLLRASPAAFRKRNLFVDAAVGDRV